MINYVEMRTVLDTIQYKDWTFKMDVDTYTYLQVQCPNGTCNVSGAPWAWTGRKWRLSIYMTKSELVQTAFKAVLTAEEHEARENFKYRGQSIFDPHYDVDKLVDLRQEFDALDERDPPPEEAAPEYDAVLRNVIFQSLGGRTVASGHIYNDRRGRFDDGALVTTSEIADSDGRILKTHNTTYLLEGILPHG